MFSETDPPDKLLVIAEFEIGGRSDEIAPMAGALIAQGQRYSAHVEAHHNELATKMVVAITLKDRSALPALLNAVGPIFEDFERAAKLTRVQCFGPVDEVLREILLPFGAEFFTEWAIAGA